MSDDAFQPRFTVAALTEAIRGFLEPNFRRIFVDGEISGWRVYPSGHAYFTLKDADAQISCAMFKSSYDRCAARAGLKDGAKVLVCGKVSVYGPRGNYQLVVTAARPEGAGDLMQRYLELREKLEKEGLFDPAKRRPLPFLPRRIGVVTSEAGAVIHDICTVIRRRFPRVVVRLYPSLVQGADAPRTLLKGLAYFNGQAERGGEGDFVADVIILGRGGGSFEDLFCFNDEALVRAVAASRIPVISAVGHESDVSLCDFAADRRAGTPSIAAEIAVPLLSEIETRLANAGMRLASALRSRGEWYAQRVDRLGDALAGALARAENAARLRVEGTSQKLIPAMKLVEQRAAARLEKAQSSLAPTMKLAYQRAEARLEKAREKMALLSPYGVLERGYALVTDASGAVVRDAASLGKGDALDVRLARGTARVTVNATVCLP